MANEKTPVVWDDTTKKHRPLGTGEKMGGLDASSLLSSDSGNLLEAGSDGLAYLSGSGMVDPRADNLLEESDRGKLQVTVDRIVEWLDGHPQDAALIADAINVVSGDSGNVITAGSDKGAFLSKGAIAAAVAGMTDAQKAQLADAIAARIASDIADGKTIVASGGKLTSDPTNATAAQKKAINQALADADSGLVVNNSTGKLQVDFSQMPTDKFEALLKGLKMLVPLDANLTLYVDKNNAAAGDTLIDGRGTAAKPFKTIQACVNYATTTYSVGSHVVYIRVAAGTYNESVTLPDFARTSGGMQLRANDDANPPVVSLSTLGTAVNGAGGRWTLHRVECRTTRSTPDDGLEHFASTIRCNSGAQLYLEGVTIYDAYTGAAPSSGHVYLRTFYLSSGGRLVFSHMHSYSNTIEVHKGNANSLEVFSVAENSQVYSYSTNDAESITSIKAHGEFTTFAAVGGQSLFSLVSGAAYVPSFVVPAGQTATGKRYSVGGSSGISLLGSQTLPGDVDGTASDTTYGWYQGG